MHAMRGLPNRRSVRLPAHDYASAGYYFVTVCAYNKINYFGDIIGDEMRLSDIGNIARKYWLDIPNIFSVASLDEFIIMPNHIHGIIVIGDCGDAIGGRDAIYRVRCPNDRMNINDGGVTGMDNPMFKKSLSRIIRWYKGRVSYEINQNNNFKWQPRFYEHIIRTERSLERIRRYIVNNFLQWGDDSENPMKVSLRTR